MNRRLVFYSAFAAMMMISVMAYGQRQGQGQRRGMGMMGRGMTVAGLLRNEAVQKEIGVTEEQATKLREAIAFNRQGFGNFRDMSAEEREKAMAEFAKAREERQKKIAEILNEKQAKRLEELRIQAMGSRAVADEEIAKKLGITDEQKEKLAKARADQRQAMQDAMPDGNRPDREAMTKIREEYQEALKNVLTEEQTAKLEKMRGKAFDMAQLRAGRRAGGGRGN